MPYLKAFLGDKSYEPKHHAFGFFGLPWLNGPDRCHLGGCFMMKLVGVAILFIPKELNGNLHLEPTDL